MTNQLDLSFLPLHILKGWKVRIVLKNNKFNSKPKTQNPKARFH